MDILLRKRRSLKGRLTRIQSVLGEFGDNDIPIRMAVKYKPVLEQLQVELDDIHNELSLLCDDQAFEAHQGEYDALATRIETLQFRLPEDNVLGDSERGTQTALPNNTAGVTPTTNVRLPRLELPTFGGNFFEWSSFFDLFSATIVHNGQLSGAQKLQYLKASLRGEASALLQSLQVTDDNFEEAWEILKGRYHNKREIINAHLKRLCSQPVLVSESPTALRKLIDTTNETVRALKVLQAPVEHWDIILVHLVSERLDPDSRRHWELSLNTTETVRYSDFIAHLEQRARALLTCAQTRTKPTNRQNDRKGPSTMSHHTNVNRDACVICKEKHPVFKCPEMLENSVEGRRSLVKAQGLCFNCLASNHQVKDCRSGGCKKCSGRHHTLLHFNGANPQPVESNTINANHNNLSTQGNLEPTRVLLGTAVVNVRDSHGNNQLCRSLVDSGSQATFIAENCVQMLGLSRVRTNVRVTGINESAVNISRGVVTLLVTSCIDDTVQLKIDAFVLTRVTSVMPAVRCNPQEWPHLPNRQLADPSYHVPNNIDILFGADVLADILRERIRKGPVNTPIAQYTTFGWLISGKTRALNRAAQVTVNLAHVDLNSAVRKFWELEEAPRIKFRTTEEKACEEHFSSTHSRTSEGRFVIRLPFKTKEVLLNPAETRSNAVRRLNQVARGLSTDGQKQQEYKDFMIEYEALKHMELIPQQQQVSGDSIYLPHHAVIKESSSTTRLRVVFDASAKSRSGLSLNDHLMVGPTIQDDMFAILLRFRTHVVAVTADITKMYRQILIHEDDTKYQNIVWRESFDQPIQDFRLLTLTYGMASSPFLAIRCLKQLAQEHASSLPEAAEVVDKDFYIDDLISGSNNVENAVKLQEQLTTLLNQGGFELRKWFSNSGSFLDALPIQQQGTSQSLRLDEKETVLTLGLRWFPEADVFIFDLCQDEPTAINTKRSVLSTIARIFDPLGWLAPITVKAKIILQQLWRTPCNWDDPLPVNNNNEWAQFLQDLNTLKTIEIRRNLFDADATSFQLHGFCDASEKAFAAAVFLRVENPSGAIEVHLVAAKTRVAPIKFVSLPRLELCGALLLANLMESVRAALRIPIDLICAWTDSTITLAWINGCSSQWKTFVANRVTEIQQRMPAKHWRHVKSRDNPADCASRGLSPTQLKNHYLWWNGPEWLKELHYDRNCTPLDEIVEPSSLERRTCLSTHVSVETKDPLLRRYSSLVTLIRVTAYIKRFLHNCMVAKDSRRLAALSKEELNNALLHWIKITQEGEFVQELKSLKSNNLLPAGSRIKTLNPFLDAVGILRVGGRLRNATASVERKFPILLPRKSELTTLIIGQEHVRNLHAGPQLLLATLQQRYWIVNGRDVVRQFVRRCVTCCRYSPDLRRPIMGDLPASRVNATRPFLTSGVDYAGPFTLRALKLRGQKTYKGYVALFVCFSTHAIHLELVSDMTTAAFLAALKRFMARRGLCSDLHSDQGTTFVGANRELQDVLKFTQTSKHNEEVSRHLSTIGVTWHFNPPAAPHFGGLWEAGVKSVKYHLRRIVGDVALNFEEMSTVLTQIEGCLNSRPLCALSSDANDLRALTPGHFLIGSALNALPEADYTYQPLSRLSRWQLVQRLFQHFWRRWNMEYLSRLQQRPKAWMSSKELKLHDLVLIKEENLPPSKWKLGRVITVHPGKDGIVRVVSVKTTNGEMRRPVVKLCKLPCDQP